MTSFPNRDFMKKFKNCILKLFKLFVILTNKYWLKKNPNSNNYQDYCPSHPWLKTKSRLDYHVKCFLSLYFLHTLRFLFMETVITVFVSKQLDGLISQQICYFFFILHGFLISMSNLFWSTQIIFFLNISKLSSDQEEGNRMIKIWVLNPALPITSYIS